MKRRIFLNTVLASSAAAIAASKGLLMPREVLASWPKNAFDAGSLQGAMTTLLGTADAKASEIIKIELNEISEDGAHVPITVLADGLDKVESISLFSEKNPIPLLANFEMTDMVANRLTTRIRLAETSYVVVVVKANGRLYSAKKKTKVTIGGCGG